MRITIEVPDPKFKVGDDVQFIDFGAPAGYPILHGIIERRYIHAFEIDETGMADYAWMYRLKARTLGGLSFQHFAVENDLSFKEDTQS